MSSLSRTFARESNRCGAKLFEQYQPGETKKPGPTGEKKEKPVRVINAHRRCTKCHTHPKDRNVKQKLYLYKGFSLCETCFKTKGD